MNLQTVVMNVGELDKSVAFYRDVLGFSELATKDQLAAVHAAGNDHPQVIVFREIGTTGRLEGARHLGMRALVVEVDSTGELERVVDALKDRGLFEARREGDKWLAVFGRDPDGTAVAATASKTSTPITLQDWADLDEALYGIGE
jgi:catechol 2,3-dioxygenase-like lactoylglutathione lyase family enzyme